MTDNERIIALKAGALGYCLSSILAVGSIFLTERENRKRIKKINAMTALLNGFVRFVNNKPVEMSGEDFVNKACEQLNFIGIAGSQIQGSGE